MSDVHFEDIAVGEGFSAGPYLLTKDEMITFATQYDPRPFHIDEAAAAQTMFAGLIASSAHTFAIAQALAFKWDPPLAMIAGLGIDEMRLPAPARPGDELSLVSTLIEKRESSKPDRGVAKFHTVLRNAADQIVLEYKLPCCSHAGPSFRGRRRRNPESRGLDATERIPRVTTTPLDSGFALRAPRNDGSGNQSNTCAGPLECVLSEPFSLA